jgi:hypothetical protein
MAPWLALKNRSGACRPPRNANDLYDYAVTAARLAATSEAHFGDMDGDG